MSLRLPKVADNKDDTGVHITMERAEVMVKEAADFLAKVGSLPLPMILSDVLRSLSFAAALIVAFSAANWPANKFLAC